MKLKLGQNLKQMFNYTHMPNVCIGFSLSLFFCVLYFSEIPFFADIRLETMSNESTK